MVTSLSRTTLMYKHSEQSSKDVGPTTFSPWVISPTRIFHLGIWFNAVSRVECVRSDSQIYEVVRYIGSFKVILVQRKESCGTIDRTPGKTLYRLLG